MTENEMMLTIGYGVDVSAKPRRNFRRLDPSSLTEFTIPGVEGAYKTDLGEIKVLYVRKNELGQPVRVGLEGAILRGRGHGKRHGHRKPYFENEIEVQLNGESGTGSQSLSKRETLFVSTSRGEVA